MFQKSLNVLKSVLRTIMNLTRLIKAIVYYQPTHINGMTGKYTYQKEILLQMDLIFSIVKGMIVAVILQ